MDAAAQINLINVTNCGPTSFPGIPSTGIRHLLVIGWTRESNAAISSITDKVGDKYAEVGGAKTSLEVRHKNWTSDIGYAANGNAGATSMNRQRHSPNVSWCGGGIFRCQIPFRLSIRRLR
jgi:hypothetical protein